ncbi:MAG: M12 family metallo-peptidase [Planctomycetota bacterium]
MAVKVGCFGGVLACGMGLMASWAGAAAGQAGVTAQASAAAASGSDLLRPRVVASPLQVSNREARSVFATPLHVDMQAIEGLSSVDRMLLVGLPLDGVTSLDLDLERVSVIDPDAVIMHGDEIVERDPRRLNEIYAGEIEGEPGSWAFLSFSRFGVRGIIETQGQTHLISSGPYKGADAPLEPVVFNLTDLPDGEISWVEFACNVIDPGDALPAAEAEAISAAREAAVEGRLPGFYRGRLGTAREEGEGDGSEDIEPDPCRVVDVAIETDAEFAELFGPGNGQAEGDANPVDAYVESLVAAVNVIYQRNVNVRLNIVFIRSWRGFPADADPWDADSTFGMLTDLRQLWTAAPPTQIPQNSVHLFSSRRLGGGIAYLRGICNPLLGFAVSANMEGSFPTTEVSPDVFEPISNNSQNWDVVVTAHEWGHNFGGPHTHGVLPLIDGCGLEDCSLAETGTIMSYCHQCPGGLANIELNFAERILNEGIRPYLEFSAPCDLVETNDACDEPDVPICRADVNGDGKLNSSDFVAWVIAFNNNDPAGDINGDGQVNPSDFFAWLAEFTAGCPQLDG